MFISCEHGAQHTLSLCLCLTPFCTEKMYYHNNYMHTENCRAGKAPYTCLVLMGINAVMDFMNLCLRLADVRRRGRTGRSTAVHAHSVNGQLFLA